MGGFGSFDIGTAIINMSSIFNMVVTALFGVAVLVGFYFLCQSVVTAVRLSKFGGGGGEGQQKVWSSFMFGMLFMVFAVVVGDGWELATREAGNRSVTAYLPAGADAMSGQFSGQVLLAVLEFVSMAGFFFSFKGLLLLKKASDGGNQGGESPVGSGFNHFFGGLACINISSFIESFAEIASKGV